MKHQEINLMDQLRVESSKANKDYIVHAINGDPGKLKIIWDALESEEPKIPMRAAWVLSDCFEKWPDLLPPYWNQIVPIIISSNVEGVKRGLLKILIIAGVPEKNELEILDYCFEHILKREESVAVKVYSMEILFQLTNKYPDLKTELKATIESQYNFGTPGFKAWANRILPKL